MGDPLVKDLTFAVVGAGFYGCMISIELARLGAKRVVLFEREQDILGRASSVNQARVHNGYHYPRAPMTAARAHENSRTFLEEFGDSILTNMEMVYAIAHGSRTNSTQFERLCRKIGAPCRKARPRLSRLFNRDLIDEVFEVEEYAFDWRVLAETLKRRLAEHQVRQEFSTVAKVTAFDARSVHVSAHNRELLEADYVFNCTYSNLGAIGVTMETSFKYELAEIALIRPPVALEHIGVTVMDGPYFSVMPFPAKNLHSLTHVRYTPHAAWSELPQSYIEPVVSNVTAMVRDASRYLPCLRHAEVETSLYDIKVVLNLNEGDDGRPILIERPEAHPRVISILGSKIDNIYDALSYLRSGNWRVQ